MFEFCFVIFAEDDIMQIQFRNGPNSLVLGSLGFGLDKKSRVRTSGIKSLRVVRVFYFQKETAFFSLTSPKNWISSAFEKHLVKIFGQLKSQDQFSH